MGSPTDLEDWLLEARRLGAVGTLSSEHEYVTHHTNVHAPLFISIVVPTHLIVFPATYASLQVVARRICKTRAAQRTSFLLKVAAR